MTQQAIEETTERNPVLEALETLQGEVSKLHNRLGYLERTAGQVKSDPAIHAELTAMRESFKDLTSKMDKAVVANMTEEQELAYWREKAQKDEQIVETPPPQPQTEEVSPEQATAFWLDYYGQAAEPDILDAAFEEGLISTNRSDLVTEEDKTVLARHAPRGTVAQSVQGIQSYKRQYIKNLKAAAQKNEPAPRPVGQTTRPLAKPEQGKLRRSDLATMTPEQVTQSKDALFAQMGI